MENKKFENIYFKNAEIILNLYKKNRAHLKENLKSDNKNDKSEE